MTDLPLITICIPTYHRLTYIRQALQSCAAQTAQNWEVIVHDDTQDDSMKEIVATFDPAKFRYMQNKPAKGQVAKMLDFPNHLRGEWMVYLCDDDTLDPGYIAAVTRQILAHPGASLIRARQQLMNEDGTPLRLDGATPEVSSPAEFIVQMFRPDRTTFRTNLTGVTFRGEALRAVAGPEMFVLRHNDRMIFSKIAPTGVVICDPQVLVNLRTHEGSLSGALDPDYRNGVTSAVALEKVMGEVLARLRHQAKTPEENAVVDEAERQVRGHSERSLQRAIDHWLMAALRTKRGSVQEYFSEADTLLKTYNLPKFQSLKAYKSVAGLPFPMRSAIMNALWQYKLRKHVSH